MRIISGSLKGRRLKSPEWAGLRPTSDRLRETLFNILSPRIAGARVLDAYAGTGALGIEALSRGAAHVVFLEQDRRAEALIGENLAHCGVAGGYVIIRASVARGLEQLGANPAFVPFDIILLDPPYDQTPDDMLEVLTRSSRVLAGEGVVVLEHGRRRQAPAAAGPLVLVREVRSGDSGLAMYLPAKAGSHKPEAGSHETDAGSHRTEA